MPDIEIELNPVDFITAGTVGPKGRRVFYLQAGKGSQTVSLTLEKQQVKALGDAIAELLDDLAKRFASGKEPSIKLSEWDMSLRDPIEPVFRVAQLGLGFDETSNQIIVVAQEFIALDEGEDPDLVKPGVVRLWGSRAQFRSLSIHAGNLVEKGRANPKSNGRVIYYWT